MNLSKSVRFAFNAMNAVKKKLLSGEIFFSALKRWKKIFHRYKQDAVKKKFSPLPPECGEKNFHRKIQRYSYKKSPLSAHSTLKDAGALRWKKFFFHRYSPLILHYFLSKARPGFVPTQNSILLSCMEIIPYNHHVVQAPLCVRCIFTTQMNFCLIRLVEIVHMDNGNFCLGRSVKVIAWMFRLEGMDLWTYA